MSSCTSGALVPQHCSSMLGQDQAARSLTVWPSADRGRLRAQNVIALGRPATDLLLNPWLTICHATITHPRQVVHDQLAGLCLPSSRLPADLHSQTDAQSQAVAPKATS